MSTTSRDRKIMLVLVVLAALAGYWFLLLSPQQKAAEQAGVEVTAAQERLDSAQAEIARLEQAKLTYASDYSSVVRLGKAIPGEVDTASLIVQLQDAADGTGISFDSITTGDRTPLAEGTAPAAEPESLGKQAAKANKDAGVGAAPAGQTAPGTTAADTASPAADVEASREDTPAARQAAAAGSAGSNAAPTLEAVPLEFTFNGSFFRLTDFFHRMKRFVQVANDKVAVSGRLITIDELNLSGDGQFPRIIAEVQATAYVSPKADVVSAATPEGPASSVPASDAGQAPAAPSTPAAAVSP